MTDQFIEGQTIASDFTLLHRIDDGSQQTALMSWLALQSSTQERVVLDLTADLSDTETQRIRLNIDRYAALIHPNILKCFDLVQDGVSTFVVSSYRRGLKPIDLNQPFEQLRPQLTIIIEALQYAHSLGFTHGAINPNCILVSDDNTPYLAGFGYQAQANSDFVAPKSGTLTPAADIYSVAQLFFYALTNETSNGANHQLLENTDVVKTELAPEAAQLLVAMLSPSATQRPSNLDSLLEALAHPSQTSALEASSFERAIDNSENGHDFGTTQSSTNNPSLEPTKHRLPRERQVISLPLVTGIFAAIIIFAAGLFWLLPETGLAPDRSTNLETTASQNAGLDSSSDSSSKTGNEQTALEAPLLAPLELAKLEELKQRGTVLAAELLRRQVEVEDLGGRLWAGERYDESSDLGIAGDEAYRQDLFQLAVDKYQAGVDLLGEVLDETDGIFDSNLAIGEAAMLSGDYEAALTAYQILTRIEPQDANLARALIRAQNLEQVVKLTADADILERNGELESALSNFKQANDIDEIWLAASDGINRINTLISRKKFQDQMSNGFTAMSNNDFEGARSAFESAQAILPSSKEPLDGLQQIGLAKTQAQIKTLTSQAQALEAEYQWFDAIPVYEKILTITPGLNGAMQGLARSTSNARLSESLDEYIQQPQLMQSDEGLAQAKAALIQASSAGDGFTTQARDLSHLVSLARINIDVLITSDNKTEVTVYQIGQYGTISSANLSVIPGVYTFVGKRSGFRDVYKEVHIKGDRFDMTVDVRCTEKI